MKTLTSNITVDQIGPYSEHLAILIAPSARRCGRAYQSLIDKIDNVV